MRRLQQSTYLLFALACFTSATSVLPLLSERQSTCGVDTLSKCPQAGLPDSFCCGPNTSCMLLAGNTTVLCCPNGTNCSIIEPIACDLSLQDGTRFPENAVKSTALTGTLNKCGNRCCPFGYTCNGTNNCIKDSDQSKAPITSSPSRPTATPSPTSASSSSSLSSSNSNLATPLTPATQSSPPGSSNAAIPVAQSCNSFPAGAVLAGFFPGFAAGILLTVACICLLGARRRSKAARRDSGSSFGNISDPQPMTNNNDMRTDFLRKQPVTPSTTAPSSMSRNNTITRVRSLFRKSASTAGSPKPPFHPPMGQTRSDTGRPPQTPPMQRQLSYENINIFADGDTASALRARERQHSGIQGLEPPAALRIGRASNQTTFTDMMEKSGLAGLQKGQPYVYRGGESPASASRRQGLP